MALLTPQLIIPDGLEATFAAADAGGDEFVNTGREFLAIQNGGGSNPVTITTGMTRDGLALGDLTFAMGDEQFIFLGPFPKWIYDDADGKVSIDYDAVVAVEIAVLRFT